jgi:hypothetical protein
MQTLRRGGNIEKFSKLENSRPYRWYVWYNPKITYFCIILDQFGRYTNESVAINGEKEKMGKKRNKK